MLSWTAEEMDFFFYMSKLTDKDTDSIILGINELKVLARSEQKRNC